MRYWSTKAVLRTGAAAFALLASTGAHAQVKTFDVPSEGAVKAIPEFARQAGIEILVPANQLKGIRTPAIKGSIELHDALHALLAGTGISIVSDDGQTIALSAPPKNAEAASTDEAARLETVVVTGTNIQGAAPVGSSIDVVTRTDIDRSGATTTDQFVRTLPQNLALIDSSSKGVPTVAAAFNNETRGTAIDLGGLGASATLVLVDGNRLAPSGSDGSFTDISLIPLSAIDRIEILNDGASAIYGSDAVAGVVNFILRKDFDGAQTSLTYGVAPDGGAQQVVVSQIGGTSWNGGGAYGSFEHSSQGSVRADQRSFVTIDPINGYTPDSLIVPSNSRDSFFGNIHQDIDSNTTLTARGLFSDRNFKQAFTNDGFVAQETGDTNQIGGTVSLTHTFSDDWNGNLSAAYFHANGSDNFVSPGNFSSFDKQTSDVLTVDAKTSGTLFSIEGGDVKGAAGIDFRSEQFQEIGNPSLSRDVYSGFAELSIPLIGINNQSTFAKSLDVDVAGRFDHYSDFGDTFNPKVGVSWKPADDLTVRGSFGTSFRAPLLSDLSPPNPRIYYILPIPDPNSASGSTVTILPATPENAGLRPETSRAFTVGADYAPAFLRGMIASITYFDIQFKNQINTPPIVGNSAFNIFEPANTKTLAPFLNRNPTAAQIQQIYSTGNVEDIFGDGLGPSDVGAIFNDVLQNLGSTHENGLKFSLRDQFSTDVGTISLFADVNYLLNIKEKAATATPSVQILNTIYNPAAARARGGLTWSEGNWQASGILNYTGDYENNLVVPSVPISSWLTLDVQVAYRWDDLSFSLSVQNIADTDPPHVGDLGVNGPGLGYDPANASALGRFISVNLTKTW